MGVMDEDYEEERPNAPRIRRGSYFMGTASLGWSPEDGDPKGGPELDRAWAKQKARIEAAQAAAQLGW